VFTISYTLIDYGRLYMQSMVSVRIVFQSKTCLVFTHTFLALLFRFIALCMLATLWQI